MSNIRICVYAICKNEEKNVDRWLDSVKDADLIVIRDTGSTDNTVSKILGKNLSNVVMKNKTDFEPNEAFNFSVERNAVFIDADNYINKHYNFEEPSVSNEQPIYPKLEWVMVSLDFDEFLEPGGIDKIRNEWDSSYNVMELTGVTNGEGEQIVDHKVHQRYGVSWERSVHEYIRITDLDTGKIVPHRYWIIGHSTVKYEHCQDLTKQRNYYSMLKSDYEEGNTDSKTLMYLTWEAINHNSYDEARSYISEALLVLSHNVNDDHYKDFEYIAQCYFNLAKCDMHNFDKSKQCDYADKYLLLSIASLNQVINLIDECYLFPIRRVYKELGDIYWLMSDTKPSKDQQALKYSYQLKCIENYKKALDIKNRTTCWVEDSSCWDDANMYSLISNAYYYSATDDHDTYMYDMALYYATLAKDLDPTSELYKSNFHWCAIAAENAIKKQYETDKIKKEENGTNVTELPELPDTKPTNKICVYAICKNESQFVDKWVDSMQEADLIVVLDTGSTDDTVEKLQARGVTVKQEIIDPWRFDIARNESLKMVPPEYNILISTDLDEVLEPGWAQVLRDNWIEGKHSRAIYKYSWSHLKNGESGRVFQYDKIHSRDWIWKYPVHELLWNTKTNTNLYSSENTLYLFDQIHLHHYPDQTKSRGSYLPLLELRAAENPDDYYGLIYLAHEYYYRGHYEQSIATLNKVLEKFRGIYDSVEESSCYLFMGDCYHELKNADAAIDSYLKAIEIDDTYREPYLNLSKVYFDQKEYKKSIETVKMGVTKSYRHNTWLERDTSWNYEPYLLLSLSYYYGGDKITSLSYAVKAYKLNSSEQFLHNNITSIMDNIDESEWMKI